jgi:hypothetical protein
LIARWCSKARRCAAGDSLNCNQQLHWLLEKPAVPVLAQPNRLFGKEY